MANNVTVSINGTSQVIGAINKFTQELGMKVADTILNGANQCFQDSQDVCPVDTGDLKASGFIHTQEGLIEVGYGTDHCWYVELGTYKMAAQPFLYPSFLAAVDTIQADLIGILQS